MGDTLLKKLEILADAAKYDASCASSGGTKRNSRDGGIGSVTGSGICHAYTPDGRCISLLKILLTNFCIYDCAYCVSRRSSNVRRARFSVDEVVTLTLDLYRRNCIEGLFLSSGIARGEDETMEDMVRVARALREDHGFRGYLHLKTIPGASPELLDEAGQYADRLSMNVELPSDRSLQSYAPEKSVTAIRTGLASTRLNIEAARPRRRAKGEIGRARPKPYARGQSTQMIVGADGATDAGIIGASAGLYGAYRLRRIYYSAFSPTGHPSAALPAKPAPLMREHRLYQADWMLRHYDYELTEIQAAMPDGMLDLGIDPKLAWALAHRGRFPVDVNRADRETLLRVPGLGPRAVDRIIAARRSGALRLEDVRRMSSGIRRARPFLIAADWNPGAMTDSAGLEAALRPPAEQLSLF